MLPSSKIRCTGVRMLLCCVIVAVQGLAMAAYDEGIDDDAVRVSLSSSATAAIDIADMQPDLVYIVGTQMLGQHQYLTSIETMPYPEPAGHVINPAPGEPQPEDFNSSLGTSPEPWGADITFSGIANSWLFSFRFRHVGQGQGGYGQGSSWTLVSGSVEELEDPDKHLQ
jgi:hypothetical protein